MIIITMIKKVLTSMFILLFLVSNIFAGSKIAYEFDSFEVVYAAKFSSTIDNWVENSWASYIVSEGKDVEVLYGIIKFTDSTGYEIYEGFIKVAGDLGSKRFLLNSESLSAETGLYSEFSSHKTFSEEGKSIIKIDSDENNVLVLTMLFEGDRLVKGKLGFNFQDDNYPENNLYGSTYTLDIDTFISEGKRYSTDYLN